MASYTKTFYLTSKSRKSGNVATTNTVKIGPHSGMEYSVLFFNMNDIPMHKTATKWELNYYCKGGSGMAVNSMFATNISDASHTGRRSVDYNISAGWNKVSSTMHVQLADEAYYNFGMSVSTRPILDAYDIEVYTHNSSYKPYVTLTYEDTAPLAPTSLSPFSTSANSKATIKFSWAHKSQEKTTQSAFTLQYSINNGTSWTTVSQTTSNQYYNMPASTLPPNKGIQWRVKTRDRNGLESGYTSAAFTTNPAAPLAPAGLYPSGTVVDTRSILRFSWAHKSQEATPQKAFTLEYSTDSGVSWEAASQTTPNEYYNLAADTLPPNKSIQWRVKTKDNNDLESVFSGTLFNTGSVPPLTPILVSPLSRYLDGTMPIIFSWKFIGGTAEDTQGKYDLEYSLDKGGTWTKATTESDITQHTIEGNTFQSSNIYWRVKTYNTYGDASPYSDMGSFFVINSPPIPQIQSVTNSSRPVISWISAEQQRYELEIVENDEIIFETGKIHAPSDKSYKVNKFLNDGLYLARLRVANEYDLNSPWAEYNFTIETVKPDKPRIDVFSGEYRVVIRANNLSTLNLIYRDNVLIGELTKSSFADYTGENGKHYKYLVRTVDAEDNFADSEPKMAKCEFSGNTIALTSEPEDFLKLKYGLDSIPKKSNSFSNQGNLVHYDGRDYPVAEHSEFKTKTKTISMILKTKKELEKLIKFIESRKPLVYRDSDGENIHGAIFSLDYEKTILGYYQIGFTISQTDHKGDAYD